MKHHDDTIQNKVLLNSNLVEASHSYENSRNNPLKRRVLSKEDEKFRNAKTY
jgi:hypothetical protein